MEVRNVWIVLYDSLISSQIANRKKRIMIRFGLFLGKFEFITNSKSELASESCYINLDKIKKEIELQIEILREIVDLCL